MDDFITRHEHEEFAKRIDAENSRQNSRLEHLDIEVKKYGEIIVSIERLTNTMEQMVQVQKDQGDRLEELESRDGKIWREVAKYILTFIIGLILSFVFSHAGIV